MQCSFTVEADIHGKAYSSAERFLERRYENSSRSTIFKQRSSSCNVDISTGSMLDLIARTFRPRWTPSSVGWTYSGQHSSINFEKQKNASSSDGMVYKNGAASTFIPWTYVNPSCCVSCRSARGKYEFLVYREGLKCNTNHDYATQTHPRDEPAYLRAHAP